jgi:hypothetical protein
MAKTPREPSLVQKDLLASKLKTGPDSDLPKATKPDFPLCEVAKCRLCKIAKAMSDFPLCKVAKCQLYKVAKAVPNIQPYNTVRPKLDYTVARS